LSEPRYFATRAEFREWLEENHASAPELLVGFWKKATGKPTMIYHEALDEALCFGWIDGVRRSLGDEAHTIRYTPRRKGSYWSDVNINRVRALEAAGRMHPAGMKAFEARDQSKPRRYTNEQVVVAFDPEAEAKFKKNTKAWEFFQSQPPSYRKPATWYVMSAKKPETRERRLAALIKDSDAGLRLAQMRPAEKGGSEL
jgi:uncharacterized protein YdeI (YjbR/CyaY-like superfamily)